MRFIWACLAFICVLYPSGSLAQQSPHQAYSIEMQIFRGNQILSSPRIVMQEGATTRFEDRNGRISVRLRLVRSPENGNRLRFSADLQHERDGRMAWVASPVVILQEGESRRIEIPAVAGSSDRQAYAISVRVTARERVSLSAASLSLPACDDNASTSWTYSARQPMHLLHRAALSFQIQPRDPEETCCRAGGVTCCSTGSVCCSDGTSGCCT